MGLKILVLSKPFLDEIVQQKKGGDQLMKESREKADDIVKISIARNQVFNLEYLDYSSNEITSAETDKMVLLSASELIKILISSNQYIILRNDVDMSHEQQYEV